MFKEKVIFLPLYCLLIVLSGCAKQQIKPTETYEMNSHGDYVNNNFKVEYDENNEIILLEYGKEREEFTYSYNNNKRVSYIGIVTNKDNVMPNTKININYYNNGEIFRLSLTNDDGINTEQYYLYDNSDKLKHIVQNIYFEDGSLFSKHITEFEYYSEDGINYVLEKTFNASSGKFESGRIYTEESTKKYANSLEMLGITTSLMFAKDYNKINNSNQNMNIAQAPLNTFFYSNKVLSWFVNDKIMSAVYDNNGNYIYTKNTTTTQTLYSDSNGYRREILSIYEDYIHRTHKYSLENGLISKLEIYEEKIDKATYEKLKKEYEANNEKIKCIDVSKKFLDYINKYVTNINVVYNSYMKTIKSNWNNYDKYKKEDNNINDSQITISDNNSNSNNNNKDNIKSSNNDFSNNSSNNNYNNNQSNNNDTSNNNQETFKTKYKIDDSDVFHLDSISFEFHTLSGKCLDCTYNVYLNDSIIKDKNKYNNSQNQFRISNLNIGNNTIKYVVSKDGVDIDTQTIIYNLDPSGAPSPRLIISKGKNTFNENIKINFNSVIDECMNCNLQHYLNDINYGNQNTFKVDLSIGENIFKIEVKNKYGKSACKLVKIIRYEYGTISENELEEWNIEKC